MGVAKGGRRTESVYRIPRKAKQLRCAILQRHIRYLFFPSTTESSSQSLHPLEPHLHYNTTLQSNQPTTQTITKMQFTLATFTALLSLTSAAAVTKRYPATLVERQSGICGGLATPLCCQTDVLGVANLNCANGTFYLYLSL